MNSGEIAISFVRIVHAERLINYCEWLIVYDDKSHPVEMLTSKLWLLLIAVAVAPA